METMGVWKSSFGLESLDTWFRTLYLVYGLGLGTPKLISCRVELRRIEGVRPRCQTEFTEVRSAQSVQVSSSGCDYV